LVFLMRFFKNLKILSRKRKRLKDFEPFRR
jgi:hypothetical protein